LQGGWEGEQLSGFLKRALQPIRGFASRFVNVDGGLSETIFYKAGNLIASDRIAGDYLEFGVFAGASMIRAYKALNAAFEFHQQVHPGRPPEHAAAIGELWKKMRFFAFDSFEGLPRLQGVDKRTKDFESGAYACTQEQFKENISKAGVPLDRVTLVPGWFEETCTEENRKKLGLQKAAMIHIDCDLYASAKTALEFVKPLLVDGTVIVFDDWYCYRGNPELGEQRAFREWERSLPEWTFNEYQKEGPWRNSFIANRKGY
jgi:hypothetical protein